MSREVPEDFSRLKDFFTGYTTAANMSNADFVKFLSTYHKKYLAYLTYIAELSVYPVNALLTRLSQKQFEFFAESWSDCGLALFDAVNGNYKAARLLLRSSIENYMKAIALDADTTIDQESSVYNLFDRVKAVSFFSSSRDTMKLFTAIYQEYKELCRDVHTASVANMIQMSALNTFPTFDLKHANALLRIVKTLVSSYVTLLTLKYNAHYHSIKYVNKEVIENAVIVDYADLINNK